jgi:hypothetical protein
MSSAALEETTNQAHRDLIDETIYLRGRIISAYRQVEFMLVDFYNIQFKRPLCLSD